MPALALPALALIGALLALLILYGAKALGRFVAHVLPTNIPIVGGAIGRAVEGAVNVAIDVLQAYLDDAAKPIAKLISYPVTAARALFTEMGLGVADSASAIRLIKRTFVPALVAAAVAKVGGWVNNLDHVLRALIASVVASIESRISLLDRTIRALIGAVVASIESRISLLDRTIRALIGAVVASIESRISLLDRTIRALVAAEVTALLARIASLQAWTAAQVQHALAFTAQRFAQAEADIVTAERAAVAQSIALVDGAVTRGLSDVWGEVATAVAAAEGAIATDFPDILAGLRAIPRTIPLDVAGEAALAGGAAIALTRYLERCGIPNCRNLSKYGRDLQDIFRLVEGGTFLTLLIDLVKDPQAAAREVDTVLGGTARGVIHEAQSLLGVG